MRRLLFALLLTLAACAPDGSSVPFGSWQGGALCADCIANGEVTEDDDGDGFCEDDTTCANGAQTGDCDDNEVAMAPGLEEVCDGLDNDCDGIVGTGPAETYEYDQSVVGFVDTPWTFAGGLFSSVSAVRISDIELKVGADPGNEATFVVYEAPTNEDPYVLLASKTVTLEGGVGWAAAGGLDAPMRHGRFYVIGALMHAPPEGNAPTQVLYHPSADQIGTFTGWGNHVEGASLEWPDGPPVDFLEWNGNRAHLIRVGTGGFVDGDNDGDGELDCLGDDDDSGDDDDVADDDDSGDDDDPGDDDDSAGGLRDCNCSTTQSSPMSLLLLLLLLPLRRGGR